MESHVVLKQFLKKEVPFAINPKNHADQYKFQHHDELIDIFLLFLAYESNESDLSGTGLKISNSLKQFASNTLEVEGLNACIESLATAFEPFLKLIAEIKYYNEPIKFKGDGINYLGLIRTTLGNLLEGKVAKTNPRDTSVPTLSAQVVTFSYSSNQLRDVIYNNIRELRNYIHASPIRTLSELIKLFRDCLSAYFLAIEENITAIRPFIDPLFSYLKTLNTELSKISNHFVELDSGTNHSLVDDNWATLEVLEKINSGDRDIQISKIPILTLFEKYEQLWLIGEPGSGKSTSIAGYTYSIANKILQKGFIDDLKIPVLIEAKLVSDKFSIEEHLIRTLKISEERLRTLLIRDNIKILFDGINELPENLQIKVQKELKKVLEEFELTSLIVSSRRYGFNKLLHINVFELLPLSINQIEIFISRYIADEKKAEDIFNKLRQSDELIMDFAKNPLLLKMLIQVGLREEIQPNFGKLFQKFVKWMFERERQNNVQTDDLLKEKLLADLAFEMRTRHIRSIERDNALITIASSIRKWNESVSPIKFLSEILDNRILVQNTATQLSFFHELVLEYYTAVKLKEKFYLEKDSISAYVNISDWHEPLIILSGLLNDADDLLIEIYQKNIILCARCISSGCVASERVILQFFQECKKRLESEEKTEKQTITALLELSTADSFRLVVKYLADKRYSFTEALISCQRPEITAFKLLNFGLTGKNRIRQCLKAFVGKPNSSSFIDSEVICNAQKMLLTGKIELDDLNIIHQLGISKNAKSILSDKVLNICQGNEINSRIFVKSTEFLPLLFTDAAIFVEVKDKINSQLSSYKEGSELYRGLRMLKSIYNNIDVSDIIDEMIEKVKIRKYYKLLLEYLVVLNPTSIKGIDRISFIKDVVETISSEGRTHTLLSYRNYFPEQVEKRHLIKAFHESLKNKLTVDSLSFFEKIKDVLSPDNIDELQSAILKADKKGFKTNLLLRWLNRIGLADSLIGYAIIFKLADHYGFAYKFPSLEIIYFSFSKDKRSRIIENSFLKILSIDHKPVIKTSFKKNIYQKVLQYELVQQK